MAQWQVRTTFEEAKTVPEYPPLVMGRLGKTDTANLHIRLGLLRVEAPGSGGHRSGRRQKRTARGKSVPRCSVGFRLAFDFHVAAGKQLSGTATKHVVRI